MAKTERYNLELVKFEKIRAFFRSDFSEFASLTNIDYSTTYNYAESWGIKDVIRELVSNALDTESFEGITIDTKRKLICIKDSGDGIKLRNLLLGNSEKIATAIGKFGEGLKLSCLVMKRKGLSIEINSNGYCIVPSSYFVEDVECFRMVAYDKPSKTEGTTILLEFDNEEEVYEALDLFLVFTCPNVIYTDNTYGEVIDVFEDKKYAYIRGVKVQELDSLYSYNIFSNELNRDRNVVSEYELKRQITRILNFAQEDPIIKLELIKNMSKSLLFECKLYLTIWHARAPFVASYGKNALILTNAMLCEQLIYRGKQPIKAEGNWTIYGVQTDVEFLKEQQESQKGVKVYKYGNEKLSITQKKNLSVTLKLAQKVICPNLTLTEFKAMFRFFDNTQLQEKDIFGYQKGKLVYISFQALETLEDSINTIFHEVTHLITGFPDGAAFSVILGKYLSKGIIYLHQKYVKRG